jgi:hypothetical protein
MARFVLAPRHVLFAVALIAGLYAWWAFAQYQRLNALHQRELADAAEELKSSIRTAFENIELFEPNPTQNPGQPVAPVRAAACQFDVDQPYLDIVDNCDYEWTRWAEPRLTLGRGLLLEASRKLGTGWTEAAAKSAAIARLQTDPNPPLARITAKVTFRFTNDALLSDLPFVGRFERVFVVNNSGTVVYQEEPGVRQRLQRLRWGERGFRDANAGLSRGLRVESMAELLGRTGGPSWQRLKAASDRASAQLGGTRFELYTHPITMGDGRSDDLVLVGVVPVSTVIREALALDTSLLAPLVFIALVSALGIPIIKLVSLGAHERFRMRDVKSLSVSCAALLIVLTFGVLAADVYQRWGARADEGLIQLAEDLGDKFLAEIADVRRALWTDDAAVALSPAINPRCNRDQPPRSSWFNDPTPIAALGFPLETTIYLDQVAWVNPEGQQVWKITSDHSGKNVNVARRAYYRAVRDGSLFKIAERGEPFFMGPEWSITDGRFYSFVSIRSLVTDISCGSAATAPPAATDGGEDGAPDSYVAVAAVRLQSVNRPPLPGGYGFAVISREGRVLYHSDDRLSLRENFFDQLTEESVARAIVQANESGLFPTGYRETPHRVYLYRLAIGRQEPAGWKRFGPTDDGGLYLAVFRDVSVERAIISRAFLNALLGPCLFLLALIVFGMWATGRISRHLGVGRDDWLWPHGTFDPLYRRQAAIYFAVLAAGVVVEQLGAGAWAYVALPIVALAGGLIAFARHRAHKVPRVVLAQPRWHLLQFGLLGCALVLVPAWGLFDVTIRHELGTLIETERRWVADQIEDMKLSAEADARAERMPTRIGTAAAAMRYDRRPRLPKPFDAVPPSFDPATLWMVRLHERLDRLLPFESDRVARLRYQRAGAQYSQPGLSIGPVGAVGLTLLVAAMVGWLRWNSTHLLFADVPSTAELHPQHAQAEWDACSIDEKHVLMQIAREGVVNPRQRPLVLRLMAKGLVRLGPNLQLSSTQLAAVVRGASESGPAAQALEQWEHSHDGRNWKDTRLMLVVSLAVVVLLVTTQPGLPAELTAVAGGVTALSGAGLKLRDLLVEWFGKGRGLTGGT